MDNKDKTIAIVAGGTGGHVFPAVAVFQKLKEQKRKVVFITDQRAKKYCDDIPVADLIVMNTIKVPKQLDHVYKNISRLLANVRIVKKLLKEHNVINFLGFGGLFSLVPLIYGYIKRIPFSIHEQNIVMGLSNRILSKFAENVFISFQDTKFSPDGSVVSGLPIRNVFISQSNKYAKDEESKDLFKIAIMGGSQGAKIFSKEIPKSFANLSDEIKKKITVIQQSRVEDMQELENSLKLAGISADVRPFISDIAHVLNQSDLIICRAGASTLGEIASIGKPAIIVPFAQSKDNHQIANAKYYLHNGCGWLVTEEQLKNGEITALVEHLINNPDDLKRASENIQKCRCFDSADNIINRLIH